MNSRERDQKGKAQSAGDGKPPRPDIKPGAVGHQPFQACDHAVVEFGRGVEEATGHVDHREGETAARHAQQQTDMADDPALAPYTAVGQAIRGINSMQLMNDGKRWWVVTIFWEEESPTTPIPQEFLNGK